MWANKVIENKRAPSSDICSAQPTRTRRRDLFELLGIYGLILVVIWTPRPWQIPMWAFASVTIIAVIAVSYEGLKAMGICTENLRRSLWGVGLSLGVAITAVYLAGRMHTLHFPSTPASAVRHFGLYALWAAIQQLILQCFFLSRSMRLLSNATAAATLSAVLFAVAHLPNPILTVITLVCGLASCLFFLRYRNLLPLAVAHAILGICIAVTIPGQLDHNMRVGISYLTYVDHAVLSQRVGSPKP